MRSCDRPGPARALSSSLPSRPEAVRAALPLGEARRGRQGLGSKQDCLFLLDAKHSIRGQRAGGEVVRAQLPDRTGQSQPSAGPAAAPGGARRIWGGEGEKRSLDRGGQGVL